MNQLFRLKELLDYQILDTDPEVEFDELAAVASAICSTPMSIISFIDDKRQWYKSKIGLTNSEVKIEDSFCQFSLDKPEELLIVEDATKNERFSTNDAVINAPFIKFYIGVPLVSPNGSVIGTLCVMNTIPMTVTEQQKNALKIIAKRVMDILNARKLIAKQKETIEFSIEKLKKLTDQAPCIIFQFEMDGNGVQKFEFISRGIMTLYPTLRLEEVKKSPEKLLGLMLPEDAELFKINIQNSRDNLTDCIMEYQVLGSDGKVNWHLVKATPERQPNGSTIWYGTFQDITSRKAYEGTIEQIAFDLSHVLRRPVANLIGLTSLISKENNLDESRLKEYSSYINKVSIELDIYTKKLNETYSLKSQILLGKKKENLNKEN
jgi:PAS domain-containing protein